MGTSNKEHPWLPHCPGDMADILLLSYLRMCCLKGKIVIAAAEKNKQIKRSLTMSNVTLPLLATCCIYIKIYRVARSQQSIFHGDTLQTSEFRSAEEKKVYSRNMRAAKTISIFVAVFFSCWIPFSFYQSRFQSLWHTVCSEYSPGSDCLVIDVWLPQFSAQPFSTFATADSKPPCRRCCYHSSPSYRSIEVIKAVIQARVGTLHS